MGNRDLFEHYLQSQEEIPFSGWDFSFLTRLGRMVEAPLPWNYFNLLTPYLLETETLLDMGTGGGEFLGRIWPRPQKICATESYPPNIALARERLEPLGIQVVGLPFLQDRPPNRALPFQENEFQLIMNRHEGYFPAELKRILQEGGHFITQQVGSLSGSNLIQFLEGKAPDPGQLESS